MAELVDAALDGHSVRLWVLPALPPLAPPVADALPPPVTVAPPAVTVAPPVHAPTIPYKFAESNTLVYISFVISFFVATFYHVNGHKALAFTTLYSVTQVLILESVSIAFRTNINWLALLSSHRELADAEMSLFSHVSFASESA